MYEKIKRSDEVFMAFGLLEDESLIKDGIKKDSPKLKRSSRNLKKNEKENDELRLCLTIAPDEDNEVDYEILDKKWKLDTVLRCTHFDDDKGLSLHANREKYSFEEEILSLLESDDEEISEGGIPRVIVLGFDGLPIQPVAPPSPDYIPGLEDPQTPPVPQDEDKCEPIFVQAHDPDYVPEPIYPDESNPEEDPEEYEDDETEDGLADYPMDGGDDGDDYDGDSSMDDANDEDEDDEDEEEEEEHLAPADSTIVVSVDEHVFPFEGTNPVIPPPSTNITIGARITVRP
ncbi:hypothetical protein Tco_0408552 [Tanacetum coccineum]